MSVCVSVCVCTWEPSEVRRGVRAPELELQMVVSHSVGTGTPSQVLCKSAKCG